MRDNYLVRISQYLENGCQMYYQDESWDLKTWRATRCGETKLKWAQTICRKCLPGKLNVRLYHTLVLQNWITGRAPVTLWRVKISTRFLFPILKWIGMSSAIGVSTKYFSKYRRQAQCHWWCLIELRITLCSMKKTDGLRILGVKENILKG